MVWLGLKIQGPPGTCIEDTGSFRYMHWRYRVLPVHTLKIQGSSGTCIEDTGSFRYMHWRYRVLSVHTLKIQGPSGTCIKDTGSFRYINWRYNVCIYLLVSCRPCSGPIQLVSFFYWCFCLFSYPSGSFRFLLVAFGNKWHRLGLVLSLVGRYCQFGNYLATESPLSKISFIMKSKFLENIWQVLQTDQ